MKWLYDEQIVSTLFLALIVVTPAAAALGYLMHYLLARRLSRRARVLWVVVAAAGPFNYCLWHLYNVIEDHWGLDRVKPLLINLALFIVLGLIIGLLLRLLLRRGPEASEPAPPPAAAENEPPSP